MDEDSGTPVEPVDSEPFEEPDGAESLSCQMLTLLGGVTAAMIGIFYSLA